MGYNAATNRVNTAGVYSYFLPDHLGSTTALTDAAGGVTDSKEYDGFGLPGMKMATRYQYTGREYDPAIGTPDPGG